MLTSFFGKSKPLNFLVLGIFIVITAIIKYFFFTEASLDAVALLRLIAITVGLVFIMLLLDFIIRKNTLNQGHNYAIYFFSISLSILPLTQHLGVVFAQLLLLLSLRRIFSIYSEKNIEKKLLDASLLIFVASYFFFWSILLFGVLYIAIILLPRISLRFFFIPFVAFILLLLIATAFFWLKNDSLLVFTQYVKPIDLNFTAYGSLKMIAFATLLISVVVWSVFFILTKIAGIPKKFKTKTILSLFTVAGCFLITLFSEIKWTIEFIFFITPSAILLGMFFEKEGDKWLKEILMWVFLLLPLLYLFH